MKNKHYDLIIAWANGAEIQVKPDNITNWIDIPLKSVPTWEDDCEYRIKPEESEVLSTGEVYLEEGWHSIEKLELMCKLNSRQEKKKPVVRWLWATKDLMGFYQRGMVFWSDVERNNLSNRDAFIKLEWSRTEFPE